ncbi:MCE family protein [Amycolatopsis sp. K13G38]|uniref:MCE family protein n=1 Tax=Amycolatopsis acididurans TaxID=2724524 RepID=A0ABX1J6R3_9PSEU|nr:MlaD family protein [Amycolatopsis acididurans]NKQ55482.1 MCE family protein [Amycolatopsis acididurans]
MAAKLRKPVVLGAVLLILVVGALFAVYQKERIGTMLSSGDEVRAVFARDYRLVANSSDVKVAGVVVGKVTDIGKDDKGQAVVSMKVDDGTSDKLGTTPSAIIRPTTLLGGNYYIELVPGGAHKPFDGTPIPVSRTSIPVELDQVLAAIPGRARQSIQDTTRLTDQTLRAGAGSAAGDLLRDAPGTLAPADDVLSALRGTQPQQDLYRLVPDLDKAVTAMTRQKGQLADIIGSLDTVSGSLAAQRAPLSEAVAGLPSTLAATKDGLGALQGTLQRLTTTATGARPAVAELTPLLQKANPVVAQARPLVNDLRPLLHQALPLVNELVPTSTQATATLNNVRGPVLDRVNGPIAKTVLSPWTGTGAYQGDGGNGHKFYEELGYLAAHTANLSQYGNNNGRMLGLGLGAGVSSVGGNDPGTAQLLQSLGLLPGGGVQLLPPPDNAGDTYTPEPATAPGQNHVLPTLPPLPLPGN